MKKEIRMKAIDDIMEAIMKDYIMPKIGKNKDADEEFDPTESKHGKAELFDTSRVDDDSLDVGEREMDSSEKEGYDDDEESEEQQRYEDQYDIEAHPMRPKKISMSLLHLGAGKKDSTESMVREMGLSKNKKRK